MPISLPVAEPETDKSAAEAAFWAAATMEEHEDTVINMQEQLLKLVSGSVCLALLKSFLCILCYLAV